MSVSEISLIQFDAHVGNVDGNAARIIDHIKSAEKTNTCLLYTSDAADD